MPGCARLADSISHGGSIVTASPNVICNGRGVARIGDAVICDLHGPQTIVSGSPNVFTNSRNTARYGDSISCGAVISTASQNVFVNGG